MEEIREMRGSVAALIATFTQQMAFFEGKLQVPSDAPATTASLATEFASIKSFIMIALKALQEQIQMTAQAVDQLEIRNRRKILLIHGVAEENKEVTATAVSRVVISQLKHAEFSIKDISRCHRMGRSSNDRPRPILVKLRDVSLRDKLWFSKTNLKDSGITISEFLTKARHEVFMHAR
ncbi:Uncharacterized protein OBRU01_12970 [Operophtera brumata]|uniref:Uncharacterized protein n=1 Tax=Operophtera brumata TaxID=104452 RepID=A0A0L7KXE0_OPEBR|nr:Uncharacterized protein OBRU01_12970 [Operophtera brumata]